MNDEAIEVMLADLLTEMDLAVSAPAWTPAQARTLLANLQAKGFEVVARTPERVHSPADKSHRPGSLGRPATHGQLTRFTAVEDCPECGDDAHLTFPSALPGAPDYGEYECGSCHRQFKVRKLDPAWDGSQPYGGV